MPREILPEACRHRPPMTILSSQFPPSAPASSAGDAVRVSHKTVLSARPFQAKPLAQSHCHARAFAALRA